MTDPSPEISGRRVCRWCGGPIPPGARRDAVYCGQRHRQAAHKFHRGARRMEAAKQPRRSAYADPPYPGKSNLYRGHPDYAGEVDHERLIGVELAGFDSWALSTSAEALPAVLALCPPGVRVAAWVRGERAVASDWTLNAWEPLIVHNARPVRRSAGDRRLDVLTHTPRRRTTDPGAVIGAKPGAFAFWMFDQLGALPGDTLVDLFPGSGGIARAWARVNELAFGIRASSPSPSLASPPTATKGVAR